MKPTEADIQAELIEGWEVTEADMAASTVYCSRTEHLFRFWYNIKGIGIWNKEQSGAPIADIDFTDFLTGNYDLSAISQHYEPEEWQRIITMCERIVRLITGEQVEQSLEEKVREILEPLGDRISDLKVIDQRIQFSAGANRYSITSDTITREGCEFTLNEYKESRLNEAFRQCLPKAAALLTSQPESEQTLEEAVRGWLELVEGAEYLHFDEHNREVVIERKNSTRIIYFISADSIRYRNHDDPQKAEVSDDLERYFSYQLDDNWIRAVRNTAHRISELATRSTKPSYSDLEQRVDELEKYIASDYCKENCELREEIDSLNESYEQIAKTKTRVLDALEATQAELKEKKSRITDLEAQLQDYISPADHEREMQILREKLSHSQGQLKQTTERLEHYIALFERESKQNLEAVL